ncbi:methyltransferase domain-containing protein [Kitasatospora griseola]|uniref:methyltransferase domain-containing protein n=1 Tax=Kitasatospora griseola TaxID=2064 RepID=UPI00380427D3
MTDALPLAEGSDRPSSELGRFLLSVGSMSADWTDTFNAVPRALFTPPVVWSYDMATGQSITLDHANGPEKWAEATAANVPLITQWDDGAHHGPAVGVVPTSSLSMPSVVMSMLRDLDVKPGMRVLDAGTGHGWNAALLAHYTGSENVVSIEYDRSVSGVAANNLARTGLSPTLVVGDGQQGWTPGAPYDRIIATYGLRRIPQAWLEQTKVGGAILAPWGTDFSPLDAVIKLHVQPDGTASGHFTEMVEFMKSRSQRLVFPEHATYVPSFPGDADTGTTTAQADDLGDRWSVQRFAIGLAVPGVTHLIHHQDDDTTVAWFYSLSDRSWAAVVWRKDQPEATVYQAGPRRLWQAVERALEWWQGQGRPELRRFGLTVGHTGTVAWLDDPSSPVPLQS